jgi:hypothetical protein
MPVVYNIAARIKPTFMIPLHKLGSNFHILNYKRPDNIAGCSEAFRHGDNVSSWIDTQWTNWTHKYASRDGIP